MKTTKAPPCPACGFDREVNYMNWISCPGCGLGERIPNAWIKFSSTWGSSNDKISVVARGKVPSDGKFDEGSSQEELLTGGGTVLRDGRLHMGDDLPAPDAS